MYKICQSHHNGYTLWAFSTFFVHVLCTCIFYLNTPDLRWCLFGWNSHLCTCRQIWEWTSICLGMRYWCWFTLSVWTDCIMYIFPVTVSTTWGCVIEHDWDCWHLKFHDLFSKLRLDFRVCIYFFLGSIMPL